MKYRIVKSGTIHQARYDIEVLRSEFFGLVTKWYEACESGRPRYFTRGRGTRGNMLSSFSTEEDAKKQITHWGRLKSEQLRPEIVFET